jgi:hypothetical protein
MKTNYRPSLLKTVRTALFLFVILPGLLGTYPVQALPMPGVRAAPATIITVDSGTDPDNSDGKTCSTSPCTLRRAIIQARTETKPVLIQFNIPADTAEGYNSTLQVWKIQFNYTSSAGAATLRYLNGDITIDGSTQPGGRSTGPKIILVGSGTGQFDGMKLGETATQNGNVIRGLGFQNFKTHLYINSSSNLVEDNWFGLSDDGTGIVLRGGGEDDGSGNTGISVSAGANTNTIQANVFTGLAGVAAAINGDDNIFTGNFIGTTAAGTVPEKQTDPTLICSAVDWLGGSGLSLSGDGNLVENNIIAGVRIAVEPPTIQADSIRMSGDNHIIRNNKIGKDFANQNIGVCGRGIFLQAGTEYNQITSNTIVEPGLSAISLNDTSPVSTSDANTLRSNVIVKSTPWGEIEGNPNPEDAIQVTKNMPASFRNFKPAKVTDIKGLTIQGTSGTSSPCPNCIVEIFLEVRDSINETLQSLAVVTADASGNWTATIPAALTTTQALRTTSTTAAYNTIAGMYAGTTTGLSELYLPVQRIFLPIVVK